MPLGVYGRADALVIVRLERIDHPSVQVHLIGCFLGTQSTPFPLGLEPRAWKRCRSLRHRSMPLRVLCADSDSGNSVCTRRAYTAAATASPSLRCARNPSHSTSGVGEFTAR